MSFDLEKFKFKKDFIDYLLYEGFVTSIWEGRRVFDAFCEDCKPIDWGSCPYESAWIYYTNDGTI